MKVFTIQLTNFLSGVALFGPVAVIGTCLIVTISLLLVVLGIYLIRKGIINDSIGYLIIGILLAGFWIGLIAYFFLKNSASVLKAKKERLENLNKQKSKHDVK